MKCPYCKKKLVAGSLKRYETLGEHVMNPNQEYHPPRKTFICSCTPSIFWDSFGDCYQMFGNIKALDAIRELA